MNIIFPLGKWKENGFKNTAELAYIRDRVLAQELPGLGKLHHVDYP